MSPLEHRWVRNVERPHGLPAAQRQVRVMRDARLQYLDNLYDEPGIGVELDGQAYHAVDERWLDIGRDNALATDGIVVLRYGWADVTLRPCKTAAQFGQVAAVRGWPGRLRPCGQSCDVGHDRG